MRFPLAAAVTILLWSLFPLLISGISTLDTFTSVLVAQVLSLLIWVIYLIARSERFADVYRTAFTYKWRILVSGLCNAAEYVAFFAALKNSNPVAPTVIFESWIVFMTIFNIAIFGTHLRRSEIAIIALAFLGIAITILDPATGYADLSSLNLWALLGLFAALCAGLKASLNIDIANRFEKVSRAPSLVPHFLTVQIAVLIYLAFAAFMTPTSLDITSLYQVAQSAPLSDLIYIALIGIVIMGAANPLFIFALQRRPTEAHSAVFYLIPLAATFWLIYFGDNELTYYVASGGFVTLIAIVTLTVYGVRFDAMMGAGVISLLSAYAIITFQKFVDLPRLMISDRFFVEIAILVFSLIGVFSVERVTNVRHAHEDATRRLIEALLANFRASKDPEAKRLFDGIGRYISLVEFSSQRRIPIGTAQAISAGISKLGAPETLRRDAETALHEWIDTRIRFYPRAHIGFVSLFGLICCLGIIVTATEALISPIFSLFIIGGIAYLVFYIFHLNNPALQDSAQLLQTYRLFDEIDQPPLISQKCLATTWRRDRHVMDFRVFHGDPIRDGFQDDVHIETARITHPEPVFVKYFSELLFVTAMAVSTAAIVLS
jgi:drug/metabolite transporter (DMT)-like permease